MKKFALFFILTFALTGSRAQTVSDFTLSDCSGVQRNLFSILDQGKLVILVYEHQCGSCLAGCTALAAVLNAHYAADTNLIVMYLDNGGHDCLTIQNWIAANSLFPGLYFEYSSDNNSPYGSGMPQIVIAAGSAHHMFLNKANAVMADTSVIHNALIAAYGSLSSVNDFSFRGFSLYPQPCSGNTIHIRQGTWSGKDCLSVELYDAHGRRVFLSDEKPNAVNGGYELVLPSHLSGIFYLRLTAADVTETCRIVLLR